MMGYFANGAEGDSYQEKYCFKCAHYRKDDTDTYGCPIWDIHLLYAYEECNSKSNAKAILDWLIPVKNAENEKCLMFIPTNTVTEEK